MQLYQKAEGIYTYWYGKTNIHLAFILNNLSNLYLKQGNLGKAEDCLIRALKIKLAINNGHEIADNFVVYVNLGKIKAMQ